MNSSPGSTSVAPAYAEDHELVYREWHRALDLLDEEIQPDNAIDLDTLPLPSVDRLVLEEDVRNTDFLAYMTSWTETYDRTIQKELVKVTWWSDASLCAVKPPIVQTDEYAIETDNSTSKGILSATIRFPKSMASGSATYEEHARSERLAGNEEAFRVVHDPLLAGGSVSTSTGPLGPTNTRECLRLGKDSVILRPRGLSGQKGPPAGAEDSQFTDFMWVTVGVMGERLMVPRLFISSGCLNDGLPVGISKLRVVELTDAVVVSVQSRLRIHEVTWSILSHRDDESVKLLLVPPPDTSLANTVLKLLKACGHEAVGRLELVVANTQRQTLCAAPFCEYKGKLLVPTDVQDAAKGIVYVLNRGDSTGLSTEPGTAKWLANLVARGGKLGGCKADKNCPVLYSLPTISAVNAVTIPIPWKFRTLGGSEESSSDTWHSNPTTEQRLLVNEFKPPLNEHCTPLSHAESKGLYKLGSAMNIAEEWIQVVDTSSFQVRHLRKNENYVAVSYTWADYTKSETQSIITTVKELTEATAIWIDKLCVPSTGRMRHLILSRMGLIYHRAALVVVMLTKMHSDLIVSIRAERQVFNWRLDKEANAEFLQEYCSKGWRTRVWTAQEGILSKSAIAVTGQHVTWLAYLESLSANNMMGWGEMSHIGLVSNDDCVVVSGRLHCTGTHAFTNTMMAGGGALEGINRQRWTLAEALRSTTGRKCTMEEDRIYAVLGLLGEAGDSVSWKYGLGWRDALSEVAKRVGISPMWMVTRSTKPGNRPCWMPDSLEELERAVSAHVFHEEESEVKLRITDSGAEVEGALNLGMITGLPQDVWNKEVGAENWVECQVDEGAARVLLRREPLERAVSHVGSYSYLADKSVIVLPYKGRSTSIHVGIVGTMKGGFMYDTSGTVIRPSQNWRDVAKACPVITIGLEEAIAKTHTTSPT